MGLADEFGVSSQVGDHHDACRGLITRRHPRLEKMISSMDLLDLDREKLGSWCPPGMTDREQVTERAPLSASGAASRLNR
jgi:hypothetical protein